MIPPCLMNITYYFDLVSIWENEPVDQTPAPQSNCGSESPAGETMNSSPEAGGTLPGDADGVNDQVAMQRVFKGYRMVAVPEFEAEAFTGYTRWIENRADDDADRQRGDDRTRKATPTRSAGPSPITGCEPSPDEPAAPDDAAG